MNKNRIDKAEQKLPYKHVRIGTKTFLGRVTAPRILVSGRKLIALQLCVRSNEAIFK